MLDRDQTIEWVAHKLLLLSLSLSYWTRTSSDFKWTLGGVGGEKVWDITEVTLAKATQALCTSAAPERIFDPSGEFKAAAAALLLLARLAKGSNS